MNLVLKVKGDFVENKKIKLFEVQVLTETG